MMALRLVVTLCVFGCAFADDCYMHLERDGFPCDDGDPDTREDQCYRGVCGGWKAFASVVEDERAREDWIRSDPMLNDCDPNAVDRATGARYIGCPVGGCENCDDAVAHTDANGEGTELITSVSCATANCRCSECLDEGSNYGRAGFDGYSLTDHQQIFPMYLGLENDDGLGGGHWHGEAASEDAVYSYMAWRHPNVRWARWRSGASEGDMRGRALFKLDGTLRSEAERSVQGFSTVEVFVEASGITVSNVRSHSTETATDGTTGYVGGPIRLGETYYTDRDYILTDLPDFLHGLQGVKTPNDDKHSSAEDTEWLCFEISRRAAVYILYDRRVQDTGNVPPAWLSGPTSLFTNEHIATVGTTDSNMGFYNLYYEMFDAGQVCLGGNHAEGVESNYLVFVGPVTDLTMHPSHRVDILNMRTHSCPNGASTPGTHGVDPANPEYSATHPALPLPGKLCCYSGCGPNCGNWDCGGSGAGMGIPGNALDYPCGSTQDPRPVLGSDEPGHALGGCVCPPDAYVGQRDCTETNDLHQDADGIEVMGGDYVVAEIGPGDMYYVDRSYTAADLPPFLQYLNGIRTANNDAHSDPNDLEFLCFDVEERVRVYVMYDARAYDQPAWLKNRFVDKHTEVIENDIAISPYYEVYSAPFEAGQVCLGGNDADGVIENYWVLVGPDEWQQFDPRSTVVSSRHFDGSSDFVNFDQTIGTYDTVTIDSWIKWHNTQGNHPIMNEDNWDVGDLHYQIYSSQFGFDVHGRGGDSGDTGDYTFNWQPSAGNWYFISVTYKSSDVPGRVIGRRTIGAGPFISLHVDDQFVEDSTTGNPIHGPAITFDSPRIGAWFNPNGVQRSMDGQLSVFRIWSIETDGQDMCAAAADVGGGLELSLILSDTGDVVHDMSGNGRDGNIHDADWSEDTPPYDQSLCVMFDLTHSTDVSSRDFDGSSDYVYFSRPIGTYDIVTIDAWIKWDSVEGNHPIMNEDNWDVGDLHYQIYSSQFGFDVHGRGGDSGDTGDYTFNWQPSIDAWYFISVTYKSSDVPDGPFIKLSVNNQFVEDSTAGNPIHGPAITFDSPRIGAWFNPNGVQRSMDGSLSMFRVWSIETDGTESCASPSGQVPGLELSLILSDTGGTTTIHDLSGHGRDGTIHDASWNPDAPPYQTGLCVPPPTTVQSSAAGSGAATKARKGGGGGGNIIFFLLIIIIGGGAMYFKTAKAKAAGGEGSMYDEKEVQAKDDRIKELENQLAMGGASAGDYEAPTLAPAATEAVTTSANPVAADATAEDGAVETL